MAKIQIEIRDDIPPVQALEPIKQVVEHGKVSEGERGRKYYCWATVFKNMEDGSQFVVATRQYRKNDCFVVYKMKEI